jgi:hypothetical protein
LKVPAFTTSSSSYKINKYAKIARKRRKRKGEEKKERKEEEGEERKKKKKKKDEPRFRESFLLRYCLLVPTKYLDPPLVFL